MKKIIFFILLVSLVLCKCDGFNWYHDIDINDCNQKDIKVLNQFINNSDNSLNPDMDIDLSNVIDPLELGWQLWEEGRLIHWICNDVPSPFYAYNYDCGLSGNIPENIYNLEYIVKLHLQSNDLDGIIPETICDLKVSNSSNYWFKINDNKLCPPYPECIGNSNIVQNKYKCR